MREWDWRGLVERLARLWRSSLQLRTVVTTVVLSGVAVLVIGAFISVSVGNNLFDQRKDQVLATSATAVLTGQSVFDDATEQFSAEDLDVTVRNATIVVAQVSGAELAILPGDTECPIASQLTPGIDEASISSDLRTRVGDLVEQRLYWQSIQVGASDAAVPGLAVGTVLDVVGTPCPIYLVYDLTDAQATLAIVQQTMLLGGLALVLLIGVVTWVVVRFVVGPVQKAAETSERLAAGELDVRLPVDGEDVIATLARSFNGMATSLQSQITRLNALSQVQQRFVSDVSHELRTPLTTIRLAGDVLYDQRESFPPATARTAELLHTQVERFELLLSDLLEMSRFDAGAVDMESEPTNLVRLVEDAIDAVRTLATSKGSDLRLVAPGGYFEADVDSRRIRRILQNLLGNAIDHGEGKPIVVLRGQRHVGGRDRRARLRCRDVDCRHGPRLRPVLARRPVAPAHHGWHRTRPRDLPRGRRPPRRLARGLVGAGRGLVLPTDPAARARRRTHRFTARAAATGTRVGRHRGAGTSMSRRLRLAHRRGHRGGGGTEWMRRHPHRRWRAGWRRQSPAATNRTSSSPQRIRCPAPIQSNCCATSCSRWPARRTATPSPGSS